MHSIALQEPVKRNPTHARFHPALSFVLLRCNHLAITPSVCPPPPLLLDTKAGRKRGTVGEQRTGCWTEQVSRREQPVVFLSPQWGCELRRPTKGICEMSIYDEGFISCMFHQLGIYFIIITTDIFLAFSKCINGI